ncbi:MAG TPA: hypothetical protein VGY66_01245 [Gemmataceae bacterium]|nr:hypothetical protein [Gemmataceae bacterium]
MTEAEWLRCGDPQKMIVYLRRQRRSGNARRWRLFACACCRRIGPLLDDERSRQAVEVAERYADGLASRAEREVAGRASGEVSAVRWRDGPVVAAHDAAGHAVATRVNAVAAADAASTARAVAVSTAATASDADGWDEAISKERQAQCDLLRCLFGNPFRPPPRIDPALRVRNDGTVKKLAEAIYQGRSFDRLPILADALEDAGCDDAALLGHLRAPGPHVKGCWALDLILGKQ